MIKWLYTHNKFIRYKMNIQKILTLIACQRDNQWLNSDIPSGVQNRAHNTLLSALLHGIVPSPSLTWVTMVAGIFFTQRSLPKVRSVDVAYIFSTRTTIDESSSIIHKFSNTGTLLETSVAPSFGGSSSAINWSTVADVFHTSGDGSMPVIVGQRALCPWLEDPFTYNSKQRGQPASAPYFANDQFWNNNVALQSSDGPKTLTLPIKVGMCNDEIKSSSLMVSS